MTNEELIAEARGSFKATNASASLIRRLADALEASEARYESAEHDRLYWRRLFRTMRKRAEVAEAERDAALAAIERVRAEARAYAKQPDVLEPCGAAAQSILTALDGAPEPEWEYRARTDYGRVVAQGSLDEIGPLSGHIWERRRPAGPWLPVEGESK